MEFTKNSKIEPSPFSHFIMILMALTIVTRPSLKNQKVLQVALGTRLKKFNSKISKDDYILNDRQLRHLSLALRAIKFIGLIIDFKV